MEYRRHRPCGTRLFGLAAAVTWLLVVAPLAFADGVDWLASQANVDGSYATAADVSTAPQSTAEVLRTFGALGVSDQVGILAAQQFLDAETYHSTEYLARIIVSRTDAGQDTAALIEELRALQNPDGGFGELAGFASTPLDTAFAVDAFALAGVTDAQLVGSAVAFLIDSQGVDGGYTLDAPNDGSVAVTALASIALQHYLFTFPVASTIDAASTFLLQGQLAGGGWASDWETALALLALAPVTTDAALYGDGVTALRQDQLPDGSWGDDAFATALALRALHLVDKLQFPFDPTQGTITGRVVSDATGLPIPAVTVSLDELPGSEAVTGVDGAFVLAGVPPAAYTVRYQAAGYTGATQTASALAGQLTDVGTLHLAPLPDVGLVAGTITDAGTGLPIVGAYVQLTGAVAASATTNSGGAFSLASPPGVVTVSAQAVGYDPVSGSGSVAAGATLTFSPALHAAGTTPSGTTVTVTGIVVEGASGQAITGATVEVVGAGQLDITDAAGRFAIVDVEAGDLAIEVSTNGYQTVRYTVLAPGGAMVDLGTVRLSPLIVATSTTVIGTVTDAQTSTPVAGAGVMVPDLDVGAVTGADGTYRIEGVGSTSFTVAAQAVGYLTATDNVTLAQHGTVTVDVQLQRGAASNFDITSVTSAQNSYPALTEVELDVVVSNTGTTVQSTRLYLKAVNGAGEIVDQYPDVAIPLGGDPAAALVAVEPGVPLTTEVEWNTARHPAGTYQLVVQAFDGTTGQLLAERGIPIEIQATNRIGGHAAFDPPIAQLAAHRPVSITATLANRGNEPIAGGTVTARLVLADEGYAPRSDPVEVETVATGQGLRSPRGMDVDAVGNVYVANYENDSVSRISLDGTVATFATGFIHPVDVDVDDAGNVYVLNASASFVRIAPDGTRTEVATGLGSPYPQKGIEALADGRVLIARRNALYQVTPDGQVTELVSGGLATPHGVAIDSEGAIFIANSNDHSIARYANGALSTIATGILQPYGIAIDAAGNLYVTSYSTNSLLKVAPDGTVTTVATGLSGPYDVQIAPDGNFVVSSSNSNEVVSITPGGEVSVLVGPTINRPVAAVYDATGNLYVGNQSWRNIVTIAPDGSAKTLATGISAPAAMLSAADGGLDLLVGNSSVVHVAPDGTKTTIASGLGLPSGLVHAPDGDGFLVTERSSSLNRIARIDLTGQVTPYLEPQLESPVAMRRTAGDDLYVVSSLGYITRIDATGVTSRVVAGLGSTRGLAVDAAGTLYVSDTSQRRVLRIDPAGNVDVMATTPFAPGALAISTGGDLLVAEWGGTKVYAVDATGLVTERAQLTTPVYDDMVVDSAGSLWVSSQFTSRVAKLAANGTETVYILSPSPRGLQLDGDGGVLVGVRGAVKRIDGAGAVSDVVAGGELASQFLNGVAVDASGRLWALTANGFLNRYDVDHTLDARFTSLASPRSMIVADDGSLAVVNGNGTVVRVADDHHLPRVIAMGNYQSIVKEAGQSALVTRSTGVERLDLVTGAVTPFASGFSSVAALAVSPDGGVTVADQAANVLIYHDANGTETDRLIGLVTPKGILFDDTGRLLVANGFPSNVSRLRVDGRLEPFASVSGVRYMLLEADGGITVSLGGQIAELGASGNILRTYDVPGANGMVRNADGDLFATSLDELVRLADDGSYQIVASGLSNATDVEASPSGVIHIADATRGVVNAIDGDGALALVAAGIPKVTALAVAPDGTLRASYGTDRLATIDAEGTVTEMDAGTVIPPVAGLTFLADTLYVATPSNDTVLRLVSMPAMPAPQAGDEVFTATVSLPALGMTGEPVTLAFGAWTPAAAGDYRVEVSVDAGITDGTATNTLHVGPSADGSLSLTHNRVAPGDRMATAALRIVGADSTSITQIDGAGTTLAAISGAQGRAIGADSQGNIYAADNDRIVQIAPDGTVSDFVVGLSLGFGLAVDFQDNIYAVGREYSANERDVLRISPAGEVSTVATLDDTARAVAVDYQGRLYAVDDSNRLSWIHDDGTVEVVATVGLSSPRGLTIDAYGNFYILNQGDAVISDSNSISRITPDGQATPYLTGARFEFEGSTVTADCSNNLLFAPFQLDPLKPAQGEEDTIFQLTGDTGELREVLYGPSIDWAMGDIDVLFYDRLGNRLLIWTDLIDGKIYSLPVVCGGIDVEAHVVTRSDVDLTSADPPPTTVIDRDDGAAEYVWSLSEVDIQGESVGLNLLFHGLTEGELRPALQDAFLTFSNSFDPGEPVQVPIPIPDLLASSAMAVAPTLDATAYGPDAPVAITATVTNDSDVAFDGTLALSIVDASGVLVADLPPIPEVALPALTSVPFTTEWSTGATYADDYTLAADLLNGAGGPVAHGEVAFRIRSGDAAEPTVTTSLFPDRPIYAAWDTVEIGGRVRNVATNAIQGFTVAEVTVTDPLGTVLFTASTPIADLPPDDYRDLAHLLALADAPAGFYTVALVARDAASGVALSTSQTSFEVAGSDTQGLAGDVSAALGEVLVGETNLCTESVTNLSASGVSGLTLRHLVASMDSGAVVSGATRVVDLAGGGTLTNTRSVATTSLQPGAYACVLQVASANGWELLGSNVFTVLAVPNQPPVADAGPDQQTAVGATVTLDGAGSSDPDGDSLTYQWTLTAIPADSTATLSDSSATTPTLQIDKKGDYTAELTVNDGTVDSAPDTVTVTASNTPPVADAGPDQPVLIGDTVTLDGSGSTDVDGDRLTYHWSILSAPADSTGALSDPSAVMPTVAIDAHGGYEIQLVVNDGTADSAPDTVLLAVGNVAPVADAGPDQAVFVGDTAILDASASHDADGDGLTYQWTIVDRPVDSTTTLSDPTAVTPTLVIDAHGTYALQLVVNDGYEDSDPASMALTVLNVKPVADAGPDQSVHVGDVATLDGAASHDADGDSLTYLWSILSSPDGSTTSFSDPTSVTPTLEVDAHGMFVLQLVVHDAFEASDPDTVVLDVLNVRPVADAGSDQAVFVGDTVTLDGSGSNDADGDGLIYQWSVTSRPPGSLATLSEPDTVAPTLVPDQEGLYIAQLIVDDGALASLPATVTIQAQIPNAPPDCGSPGTEVDRVLWPPNHAMVVVAVAGITDPDGDPLTVTITGVTQDEPVDDTGDGSTGPDAIIEGDQVQLRKERSGSGNGRAYEVQFTADDGQGGSCAGVVRVGVPLSQGQSQTIVDDGQNYDATRP